MKIQRIKFIFLSFLSLVVMVIGSVCYGQETGDKDTTIISKPDIYRNQKTTYIAAAQVFKALGDTVEWRQNTKSLSVNKKELLFTLDKTQVETIKGNFTLSKAVISKDDKLYIPLNCLSNILGYQVSYKDGVVTISGKRQLGIIGTYEELISEKRITISAAGDFTLGTYKGQGSGGRFDEVATRNGYAYFMKGVKSIFANDDLTIANLEGPLTTRGIAAEKEFAIRGLPEYTQILTQGNIEVVNLANNHTYDYQKVGYDDTIAALEKSNISYFGEDKTCYLEVQGVQVALIGAKGWSNSKDVKEKLRKRITEAKNKAEIIIVEFHWGIERENYPNGVQIDLAKYVIDQGANLVLGSHPHVVQGIGSYKGVNIVYSMGNFCFGANKNPSDKDSFIYQQTFTVSDSGIEAEAYHIIPCSISSTNSRNDYQPTILNGEAKKRVLDRLNKYSKNLSN